jgi:hypothetical protein
MSPPVAGTVIRHIREDEDRDINSADTVAINSTELFDATVQMSAHEFVDAPRSNGRAEQDDTLESTADLSGSAPIDMEESTIVLDEEALAFARRSKQ